MPTLPEGTCCQTSISSTPATQAWTTPDSGWQARDEEGFDLARFGIDWEQRQVTCPNGKTAHNWRQGTSRHGLPVRVDAWLTGAPLGGSWGLSPHQTPTTPAPA